MGQISLLAGDFEGASAQAVQLLEASRSERAKGRAAWALHLLGDIQATRPDGDVAAAERVFRDSLALSLAQGMRPLQAHCHLGLGKLFARAGDKSKAREHLGTAVGMMREMGMGLWLLQAEAALAEATASQ
jgi:hypothetical protein